MKLIPLSQNSKTIAGKYFAMVDDEDYDFLMQWRWQVLKGCRTFYAKRAQYNKVTKKVECFQMHRILLGLKNSQIWGDHRDHNGLNNQRVNLRASTISQNCANLTSHINSTSKYLGVCWLKTKHLWLAAIKKNGKINRIGTFEQEIEAAEAYNNAAKIIHGEFANLNVIDLEFERLGKRNPHRTAKSMYISLISGRNRNKYRLVIRYDNNRKHIGYFATKEDAVLEYNKIAKDYNLEPI